MAQRKLILFIAVSLDGYIAGENHEMDWLFNSEGEGDNGFAKFYSTIDTVLVGRATYDWILQHESEDAVYRDKKCYVFTRIARQKKNHVTFIHEDAADFVRELKNKSGKDIWLVGGGELLHVFLKEKLVDECFITIAPVLLGKGIPLFKGNDFETRLSLQNITKYGQMVELHYKVDARLQ